MAEKKFLEKILFESQQTFFKRVGIKFRASSLRNFMNKIFEFFEKKDFDIYPVLLSSILKFPGFICNHIQF